MQNTFSERLFGGVERLYGRETLARFQAAKVAVVGVGGVGSWAVEALARSAVGCLHLIDMDHIAPSNTNRQIQALAADFGKAKVAALKDRIAEINPQANVVAVDEFLSADNLQTLITPAFDYVIDAIDEVKTKAALAAYCVAHRIPLMVAGSAGARFRADTITCSDLTHVTGDRMLANMRYTLKKRHGFSRDTTQKMGIMCVHSKEIITLNTTATCTTGGALSCEGYGSSVIVTASLGLQCAYHCLHALSTS